MPIDDWALSVRIMPDSLRLTRSRDRRPGWLACLAFHLQDLVLEAMAFSSDFMTAVTPIEPLTFNIRQCPMPVRVVEAIRWGVQGGLCKRAIQGVFIFYRTQVSILHVIELVLSMRINTRYVGG